MREKMTNKTTQQTWTWSIVTVLLLSLSTVSSWAETYPTIGQMTPSSKGVYTIKNTKDISALIDYVNKQGNSCKGYTFEVVPENNYDYLKLQDLTIRNTGGRSIHTPIGTIATPFRGTFDGKHIRLQVSEYSESIEKVFTTQSNGTQTESRYINWGIFGVLGPGAVVKNVRYESATKFEYVITSRDNEVNYVNLGSIAGMNKGGTIQNSSVSNAGSAIYANVKKSTVYDRTTYAYLGGIVGYNSKGIDDNGNEVNGIIKNDTLNAQWRTDIQGKIVGNIGGIAGNNYGEISNAYDLNKVYSSGDGTNYVGGIVGTNYGSITNCIMKNSVVAENPVNGDLTNRRPIATVGGIAGYNKAIIKNNSVMETKVSGSNAGAIVGSEQIEGTLNFNYYYDMTIYETKMHSGAGVAMYNNSGSNKDVSGTDALGKIEVTPPAKIKTTAITIDNQAYYPYNSTITLGFSDNVSEGYTVVYTIKDNNNNEVKPNYNSNTNDATITMPPYRASVSAKKQIINYKITYVLHGGTNPSSAPTTYTVDKTTTLPNPTRSSWVFGGWYTNENFTGNKIREILYGSTGNKTFYARWIPNISTNDYINISNISDQPWTGKEIKPQVSVLYKTTDITNEMTITYSNNIDIGTATVTITAKSESEYKGSRQITFKIVKATPSTTVQAATNLTYNGTEQKLVTAGTTNHGKLLYSLDGNDYSERIPTAVNAGSYTVYYKVEGDEHYNQVNGSVAATILGTYTKNGAIAINEDANGKHVSIDGDYGENDVFNIPEGFDAADVTINRTFATIAYQDENGDPLPNYSTIVFPFDINADNILNVTQVAKFLGVRKNNGVMEVCVGIVRGSLNAYTPYLIQLKSGATDVAIDGNVTFQQTPTMGDESALDVGKDETNCPECLSNYVFRPVLQKKTWTSEDDEIKGINGAAAYGYVAQDKDGIANAGEFVIIGAGSYIKPLRAYIYKKPNPAAINAQGSYEQRHTLSINNDVPDRMNVVIVDKDENGNEHTTVIGHINTRTGEFRWNRTNRTFDLKGRAVNKNTRNARGAYYGKQ